ncbi:MAG: FkbM family methyltransferase [Pseudomonadota bacterium]
MSEFGLAEGDTLGRRKMKRELVNKGRALLRDKGWPIPNSWLRGDEQFIRRVARELTRRDTVIDLGAHVGIAAIEFSHHAGRVLAYEPHPEIFQTLRRNVRNYRRIVPINKAIWTEEGSLDLFFGSDGRTDKPTEGSTLMHGKSNLDYQESASVETVKLSDVIDGIEGGVRLIKMDIEGAEARVIAELVETPAVEKVDKVYVETHEDRIEGLGAELDAVRSRIEALGLTSKFDFTWP